MKMPGNMKNMMKQAEKMKLEMMLEYSEKTSCFEPKVFFQRSLNIF